MNQHEAGRGYGLLCLDFIRKKYKKKSSVFCALENVIDSPVCQSMEDIGLIAEKIGFRASFLYLFFGQITRFNAGPFIVFLDTRPFVIIPSLFGKILYRVKYFDPTTRAGWMSRRKFSLLWNCNIKKDHQHQRKVLLLEALPFIYNRESSSRITWSKLFKWASIGAPKFIRSFLLYC